MGTHPFENFLELITKWNDKCQSPQIVMNIIAKKGLAQFL